MEHNELQNRLQSLVIKYPNEDVENVYNTAIGFYDSISKRWPPSQFRRVLVAEGGRNGLVYAFTIHGVAASPQHLKGFIEYSNYIRRLYNLGDKYVWSHISSLDETDDEGRGMYDYIPAPVGVPLDITISEEPVGEDDHPLSGSSPDRPSGALMELLPPQSSQYRGRGARGKMKPLSDEELDFLDTLAYVGTPSEAARLVGRSPKWGFAVVRKLRIATTRVGATST